MSLAYEELERHREWIREVLDSLTVRHDEETGLTHLEHDGKILGCLADVRMEEVATLDNEILIQMNEETGRLFIRQYVGIDLKGFPPTERSAVRVVSAHESVRPSGCAPHRQWAWPAAAAVAFPHSA